MTITFIAMLINFTVQVLCKLIISIKLRHKSAFLFLMQLKWDIILSPYRSKMHQKRYNTGARMQIKA